VSLWGDLSRVLPEMDKGIDFLKRLEVPINYPNIYTYNKSIYKYNPYVVLPVKVCNHYF
jgi:hypothetical protein